MLSRCSLKFITTRRLCSTSTPSRPFAPSLASPSIGRRSRPDDSVPTRRRLTDTVGVFSTPAMPCMAAMPAIGSFRACASSKATTERLAPVSTTNSNGPSSFTDTGTAIRRTRSRPLATLVASGSRSLRLTEIGGPAALAARGDADAAASRARTRRRSGARAPRAARCGHGWRSRAFWPRRLGEGAGQGKALAKGAVAAWEMALRPAAPVRSHGCRFL